MTLLRRRAALDAWIERAEAMLEDHSPRAEGFDPARPADLEVGDAGGDPHGSNVEVACRAPA